MKNSVLTFILACICSISLFAQSSDDAEKTAIKKVIHSAYINGLQNLGSIDSIKMGFDPTFELLGIGKNNELTRFSLTEWLKRTEQRKKENPNGLPPEKKVTCDFDFIDITGNSAVAKFKFLIGGKQIFTDYLFLYKFNEGWKIVSKIYYRHVK